MRCIILDTETTGLDPKQGHRVIELAAVEVVDRRLTGRNVHFYINPEREIDAGASDVHGLTWDMLRDKPRFGDQPDFTIPTAAQADDFGGRGSGVGRYSVVGDQLTMVFLGFDERGLPIAQPPLTAERLARLLTG